MDNLHASTLKIYAQILYKTVKCMYIIASKLFTLLPIKNKTNNNKHVICQLYNMKIQKEVKSSLNSPAVKEVCGPQECCCEERCEIQSGGQEKAVMVRKPKAKILITTIQVNLVPNQSEMWKRQHKFT